MITDVADYFTRGCGRCARFDSRACSTAVWAPALATLRDLCRAAGLEETVKWGHPCYMHAGRNVALIGATLAGPQLSLFEAGLLSDPLLRPAGPNSRVADTIFLTDAAEVAALAPRIAALLAEAKAHAAAGRRAARVASDLDLPDELVAALDADPALAEAFAALTPGRQRSHVLALTSTANPATRRARIQRLRGLILAGKDAQGR